MPKHSELTDNNKQTQGCGIFKRRMNIPTIVCGTVPTRKEDDSSASLDALSNKEDLGNSMYSGF